MGSDEWTPKKTQTGDESTITLTTTSTIPAGTSVTVTLFEDVGNDGSGANTDAIGNAYDNSANVTLSGGTDETNDLTGFDGGGSTNAYWLHIEKDGDGADPTLPSPTLNRVNAETTTATAGQTLAAGVANTTSTGNPATLDPAPATLAAATGQTTTTGQPATLSVASPGIAWETAADWDAGQQEMGVRHEQPSGTDWGPADTLEKGLPADWSRHTIPAPDAYWPLEEGDSGGTLADGATVHDVVASNDITINGVAVGAAGLLGASTLDFNGTDDETATANLSDQNQSQMTIAAWAEADSGSLSGDDRSFLGDWRAGNGTESTMFMGWDQGNGGWRHTWMYTDDSLINQTQVGTPTEGQRTHFVSTFARNDEAVLYLDGVRSDTTTTADLDVHQPDQFGIGWDTPSGGHGHWDGPINGVAVWLETKFSDSQVSDLTDAVLNTSEHWARKLPATGDSSTVTLTTSTTIPTGTSVTITLYEDVGGDGSGASTDAIGNSFDNSDSVTLSGGADETNDLTGFDGTGSTNDYWVRVQLSGDGTDPTLDSPTLSAINAETTSTAGQTLTAGVANTTSTGNAATLNPGPATLTASTATTTATGNTTTVDPAPATLTASTATTTVTGNTTTVDPAPATLAAATGQTTTTGQSATLDPAPATLTAAAGQVTVTGQPATISVATPGVQTLSAGVASVTAQGNAATLDPAPATLSAGTATVTVDGQPATVDPAPATLVASVGSTTAEGQSATLDPAPATLQAGSANVSSQGQSATLDPGAATLAASTGTVAITGQPATIVTISTEGVPVVLVDGSWRLEEPVDGSWDVVQEVDGSYD